MSSEKLGPPKGFNTTTEEFINNRKDENQDYKFITIHPSQHITRMVPRTIDAIVDSRFERGYLGKFCDLPKTFVAVIPNGRVCGEGGAVIGPNDKLMLDLSPELHGRGTTYHSKLRSLKLPRLTHFNETTTVLASPYGHLYFHWMFDVLPRTYLLKASGFFDTIDKFILNTVSSSFQRETLDILGIPLEKIINSNPDLHMRAIRLVAPSLPGISGAPPYWVCNFLKETFVPNQDFSEKYHSKRIYLSRSSANSRKILNEDEVITFLSSLGFKIYKLEKFTVLEQAAILANAEIIVAPHGGALTNLVFCKPGTHVIELFSPKYINPCYRAVSDNLRLDYWYLIGEGLRQDYSDKHLFEHVGDDMRINVKKLSDILNNLRISE